MKKIISLVSFTFLLVIAANSQITVQNTLTAQQLIDNVLVGAGVSATNITVNGSAATAATVVGNATYFNANSTSFPIPEGVLLTTGMGNAAIGPNNGGGVSQTGTPTVTTDPHLNQIANANVTNGIVLEFDFVATGNLLQFDYIFGSEEYPEFVDAGFNDAFGFFLWGPGISGPFALGPYPNGGQNIAIVPGTAGTPVTIDNVSPVTNAAYYANNGGGAAYGNAIQYDGTTVLLTATSDLICGETYHIKLAICNIADQGWDSGVFLEAGSFTTNPVEFTFNAFSNDNTAYEGCNESGELIFTRAGCGNENDSLIAYVTYSGSATNGVDYNLLADSVILAPGVDTVVWNIVPLEDFTPEGMETIIINVTVIDAITGDTLSGSGQFFINDQPPIILNANTITYVCREHDKEATFTVSGGLAPYTYQWSNGDTTLTTPVDMTYNGDTTVIITVTDACGYTAVDTANIIVNQTLFIDTLTSMPSTCDPTGAVIANTYPYGATDNPLQAGTQYLLNFTWTNAAGQVVGPNQSSITPLPSGWYYLELEDSVIDCRVNDSVFVDMIEPPIASMTVTPSVGCSPLTVTITNNSQNASTFLWNYGNGNTDNTSSMSTVTQVYNNSGIIQLIAIEGNCSDTTYAAIAISICGCMDPNATNYNPLANADDGSCTYPEPIVDAPNIFTPNNDNANDLFFVNGVNTTRIELTVLNRWGNVMYNGAGPNPAWDGKSPGGALAEDGTYFYKYIAWGLPNALGELPTVEGHGFVQLAR
ncbi:MAG: choice-of-anchor L domain-containing protein [Bacteroidota bacterium]